MSATREFVDSGVEWLERLPSDWRVSTLGRESWVRARLGWKGLKAEEYVDEGGLPMLSTPDIKSRDINFESAARITEARFEESPEIMLQIGDVLLTKDGSTIGTANIVRELPEPATLNGSIALLTPSTNLNGRYLYYVIVSRYAQAIFDLLRGGAGVPHLFQRDINRIRIPLPPLDEQHAIADYLDQETAQIDALVAKQEEFIGLLRERRRAIVTDAVQGLETIKLRRLVRPDRPMSYGILQAGDHVSDGVPYLGPSDLPGEGAFPQLARLRRTHANIAASYERSRLLGGDVVVSIGPAYGRVAVVPRDLEGANLTQDTVRVALDDQFVDTRFIVLVLGSDAVTNFWDTQIQGATFRRLNLGTLATTPIPFGPLPEQRRLSSQIDEQTVRVDALIAKATEHIALAKERRSALITAAVTGQFDVRTAKKGTRV